MDLPDKLVEQIKRGLTRDPGGSTMPARITWGAAAVAVSGRFTVEIDRVLDGTPGWELIIDSPAIYFRWKFADAAYLQALLAFLQDRDTLNSFEFEMTQDTKLVRDHEAGGRMFFCITGSASSVQFPFFRPDAEQLAEALADAISQLT